MTRAPRLASVHLPHFWAIVPLLPLAFLAAGHLAGEDSLAESINGKATAYETRLLATYQHVGPNLDGWLATARQQVLDQLHGLMGQNSGEAQLFVAFHCLLADPHDAQARQAFSDAKQAPPMDEQGAAVGVFNLSGPVPADLAQRVAQLEHPGFDQVALAFANDSSLVSAFWNDEKAANQDLLHALMDLTKKGQDALIYQLLAFYYPDANETRTHFHASGRPVPTERWWVDPVDQFLIDHELMGRDCLQFRPRPGTPAHKNPDGSWAVSAGTWTFPSLRSCRVEMVAKPVRGLLPSMMLGEEGSHGGVRVLFNLPKKTVQLIDLSSGKPIGSGTPMADLTQPMPIEIEIRDRHVQLSVGGLPLIVGELKHACLLRRFCLDGDMLARSLSLRFISSTMPGASVVLVKPAEWPEERRKQLEKPISISFAETPVEEVVVVLSRLSGLKFSLDDSGQLLKDLPITLEASDMKLSSVLDNLGRQSDLRAQPTETGFMLSWVK